MRWNIPLPVGVRSRSCQDACAGVKSFLFPSVIYFGAAFRTNQSSYYLLRWKGGPKPGKSVERAPFNVRDTSF